MWIATTHFTAYVRSYVLGAAARGIYGKHILGYFAHHRLRHYHHHHHPHARSGGDVDIAHPVALLALRRERKPTEPRRASEERDGGKEMEEGA